MDTLAWKTSWRPEHVGDAYIPLPADTKGSDPRNGGRLLCDFRVASGECSPDDACTLVTTRSIGIQQMSSSLHGYAVKLYQCTKGCARLDSPTLPQAPLF